MIEKIAFRGYRTLPPPSPVVNRSRLHGPRPDTELVGTVPTTKSFLAPLEKQKTRRLKGCIHKRALGVVEDCDFGPTGQQVPKRTPCEPSSHSSRFLCPLVPHSARRPERESRATTQSSLARHTAPLTVLVSVVCEGADSAAVPTVLRVSGIKYI